MNKWVISYLSYWVKQRGCSTWRVGEMAPLVQVGLTLSPLPKLFGSTSTNKKTNQTLNPHSKFPASFIQPNQIRIRHPSDPCPSNFLQAIRIPIPIPIKISQAHFPGVNPWYWQSDSNPVITRFPWNFEVFPIFSRAISHLVFWVCWKKHPLYRWDTNYILQKPNSYTNYTPPPNT